MMILDKFKNWLSKDDVSASTVSVPENAEGSFVLSVDGIQIAHLRYKKGIWEFRYTAEFKQHSDAYHPIVGFSNLDRVYQSSILWPFFLIRIPGLKQPAVQEVLKRESIDATNEVALLKRFGRKSIANPYELNFAYA